MKFNEMAIPANILESLKEMRFEDMTPIQEATYSIIASGQDLCARAETGSGKTAACVIPLLPKIDPTHNTIQGLVIVPTRELCLQYVQDIRTIGSKTGVVPAAVYGGVAKSLQVVKIKHEAHILVATPGRLIDLMYSGVVEFPDVKFAVLDEADELLKEGFLDDIAFILSCIRQEHQTLLFSATMPDDIKKLADNCMSSPRHIALNEERVAPVGIRHCFTYLSPAQKNTRLVQYLRSGDIRQAIIFCNARHRVDKLFQSMNRDIGDVECIHAGISQEKRTSIFRRFKSGKIRYLIATDVAGRGLDFTNVSHIVNWDFPEGNEQYTHRTGRTGRMGKKGTAYTLVTQRDLHKLRELIRNNRITPFWIGQEPGQWKAQNSSRQGCRR